MGSRPGVGKASSFLVVLVEARAGNRTRRPGFGASSLRPWEVFPPSFLYGPLSGPRINAGLSRLPYGLMPRFRVFRQHPQLQHRSLRGIVQDFLPHPNIVPGGQRYCTSTGGESNHDQFAESDCASRCHSIQLYLRASTENWCGMSESNRLLLRLRRDRPAVLCSNTTKPHDARLSGPPAVFPAARLSLEVLP